jgi:ABC-type transport system involved in cytochrome c biogenesis permease subunit
MPEVSLLQLGVLVLAAAQFAVAAAASIVRSRKGTVTAERIARISFWSATGISLGLLLWHSISQERWLPLSDNFTALVWLAILLALFVAYVQRTRPLVALNGFVLPIVVALLLGAGIFGRIQPHEYVASTWSGVHRLSAYGGAAAFAVAASGGLMYLLANRRLRAKTALPSASLGSLERLEQLTLYSVTVGFPLLTIGLITGLTKILSDPHNALGAHWFSRPKVLLTFGVWVTYGLVLHAPLNPSFRGRRAALLSVIGFVLMIGTLVAVQFMPTGASH